MTGAKPRDEEDSSMTDLDRRVRSVSFCKGDQNILMCAPLTPNTDKSIMQDTAIWIAINHMLNITSLKALLLFKEFLIELFKDFKIAFSILKILQISND